MSGKAYAWRLLGVMPAISKAATVAQTTEWLAEQQTLLYHLCIDILVQQINDFDLQRYTFCTLTNWSYALVFYGLFINGLLNQDETARDRCTDLVS